MTTRITTAIIMFLFITSWVVAAILYNNNKDLQEEVMRRDALILEGKRIDSLYYSESKKYAETITKYTSNCEIKIDGKTFSTSDFVKLLSDQYRINDLLEDSILNLRDSLYRKNMQIKDINYQWKERGATVKSTVDAILSESKRRGDTATIYRKIVELINREYGIEFSVEQRGDHFYFSKNNFSKADSGLLLLPYYRNKISKDPESNNWIIITK